MTQTGKAQEKVHLVVSSDDTIFQTDRQAVLDGKVQLQAEDAVQPDLTPLVQSLLSHWLPCNKHTHTHLTVFFHAFMHAFVLLFSQTSCSTHTHTHTLLTVLLTLSFMRLFTDLVRLHAARAHTHTHTQTLAHAPTDLTVLFAHSLMHLFIHLVILHANIHLKVLFTLL